MDSRKYRWWLLIAILACLGLYLLGNGRVPLWDRDEGWYAQCSKQMWETGDWVVPRFLDDLRAEKPALVYWLQLGGYYLFGGPGDFAVRFYAGVAQALAIAILGFSLFKLSDPRRATWTAVIYGTCVMAIVSAKMCLCDSTLMVFLVTAQMCLMAFYLGKARWGALLLLFIALGLGGLTKGPVAVVPTIFTLLALAILDYQRWLPQLWRAPKYFFSQVSLWTLIILGGLLLVAAINAAWLIPLHLRAPQWLGSVLNIAKGHVTTSMDGHSGISFGTYLLYVWGTFFPWSLLLPTAVYIAWKNRRVPQVRFAIAAVLGPWLFFECMKTKLPHYNLPTFPFLAFLVADALVRCAEGEYREFAKKRFLIPVAIWAIVIGALPSAVWLSAMPSLGLGAQPWLPMVVLSIAGYVFTLGVWWNFYRHRSYRACGWMAGSFLALIAILYGWYLPQVSWLRVSPQIAAILAKYDGLADKATQPGEVVMLQYKLPTGSIGYEEPTLPYYQGGTLRLIKQPWYLDTTPPEKWPRLMVITRDIWNVTKPELQKQLEVLGTVRGLTYTAGGKIIDVMVVRRIAKP